MASRRVRGEGGGGDDDQTLPLNAQSIRYITCYNYIEIPNDQKLPIFLITIDHRTSLVILFLFSKKEKKTKQYAERSFAFKYNKKIIPVIHIFSSFVFILVLITFIPCALNVICYLVLRWVSFISLLIRKNNMFHMLERCCGRNCGSIGGRTMELTNFAYWNI